MATFIDITKEEEQAREDYEKNLETIDLAQKVIHKQMMVAQEIAGLLGETTAETKTTLTKLCKSLLDDSTPDNGFTGGEEDASRPGVHLGSAGKAEAAESQNPEQHTGYVSLGKARCV